MSADDTYCTAHIPPTGAPLAVGEYEYLPKRSILQALRKTRCRKSQTSRMCHPYDMRVTTVRMLSVIIELFRECEVSASSAYLHMHIRVWGVDGVRLTRAARDVSMMFMRRCAHNVAHKFHIAAVIDGVCVCVFWGVLSNST